jgi:hypothetical protein
MRISPFGFLIGAAFLLLATVPTPLQAQFTVQPSIGLQTLWFNGDYPVRQPISPGVSRDLPLGGGVIGNSNGLHLQADIIPDPKGMFSVPVTLDAFFLSGKTTFAVTRILDKNPVRWQFRHSAQIYSIGTGLKASFFDGPVLYFSAEGKLNYIPSTELTSRIYYTSNDETIEEVTLKPDPNDHLRGGAYIRIGTKLEFYEPVLIDFSIGYGALNLIGKETDPKISRNLLVVDNRPTPEVTIGYIGIGLSIIWKL